MSRLLFQDARNDAEQHIYQQLNAKIDEFMDLGEFACRLQRLVFTVCNVPAPLFLII